MAAQPVVDVPLLEGTRRLRTQRPLRPRPASLPVEPEASSADRGRALLETHFDLIQQKLHQLGRRSGLPEHEAEELSSWALFRLVEDDYRILVRWEGRSSFSTYLTVVLVNLMRDYRIHVWGKWRPSAAAARQGPEAVLLEKLLFRDGLGLDEAIRRMRNEHGVSLPSGDLERIASTFPPRTGRRWAGEEELSRISVDGQVESRVEDAERAAIAARLRPVLSGLLKSLPAEDFLLLKLHFQEGLTIAAISSVLRKPQRELYPVRDRCLRRLRHSLEEAGLDAGQILALFSD